VLGVAAVAKIVEPPRSRLGCHLLVRELLESRRDRVFGRLGGAIGSGAGETWGSPPSPNEERRRRRSGLYGSPSAAARLLAS
jgi:hypothetical protein